MDRLAIQLGQMLHIFRTLDRRPDPKKWTSARLMIYTREQDECWAYAQAVSTLAYPALQKDLDNARREVMDVIDRARNLTHGSPFGAVIVPVKRNVYQARWSDHQITPEFTRDPTLSGFILPRALAQKVVKLHRQQVSAVTGLVRAVR